MGRIILIPFIRPVQSLPVRGLCYLSVHLARTAGGADLTYPGIWVHPDPSVQGPEPTATALGGLTYDWGRGDFGGLIGTLTYDLGIRGREENRIAS